MKNYQIKKYFEGRLGMWMNGDFLAQFLEEKAIQARIRPGSCTKQRQIEINRPFMNLISNGKINAVLRLLCNSESNEFLPEQTTIQLIC